MRNQFLGVCAGLLLSVVTGPLQAGTIHLSPIGDVPTVISAPGRVAQSIANVFSSPTDVFGATVSAEADESRGVLRTFANHGGDVGTTFPSQASAKAIVSGTGTITGPITGPVQGSFIYNFHAAADTLTGQTGAPVGGISFASFQVNADVGTFFNIFQTGATGFTSAQAGLQYVSEHIFGASSPSTISSTVSRSGVRASSIFRNSPSLNNVLSDNDITISVARATDFIIEGVIEILFTAQVGDRMRFMADMTALANAAPGHIAGMNALNTGTMAVRLPEGFGFLPDDGSFLTQQAALTAVPLPPSVAMLLAGLAGMGLLRKRWNGSPGRATKSA